MISPRKYAVPRRSAAYYANENGERRRSMRQAAAGGVNIAEIEAARKKKEEYDADLLKRVKKNKVKVAKWNPLAVQPCEDKDREELLFDPEQTRHIDHEEVQKFLIAAHNKLGSDTHDNMVHLVKHKCDFKEALETIDAVDSVPNKAIRDPNGIGIWSKKELQILTTLWNLMRKKKTELKTGNYEVPEDEKEETSLLEDLHQMKKMLPQKTTANINNAIYWLKVHRCTPQKKDLVPHQFCEKKVHRAVTELNIRSADCANCREKLWMKPLEEYPEDFGLCSLCILYHITFKRFRPNAAVTPEVFPFEQLERCICEKAKGIKKTLAVKETDVELPKPNKRKSCNSSVSHSKVKKMLTVMETNMKQKATITTEVFNIKPLAPIQYDFALKNKEYVETLRKCLNKDILTIDGANIGRLFQGLVDMSMSSAVVDLATSANTDDTYVFVCRKGVERLSSFPRFDFGVPSAAGSDENADPSEAYKFEVLQICWDMHAYSKNNLSFAALQWWTKREKIDLKEAWRKDFEAGKAGGPEPDCMLYGTITANGRIMPGTDATFAKYFDRITA
uniref:ELM2 domain-containing protein n=1 Tax=Panagrellus redivivus TaxID=6233 RepID=A0A7E4V6E4_PANRE